MRIAIMGTGGIGGYYGARLAQHGEDVVFVARGEHLAAMRKNGLQIKDRKGDFAINPVQATDDVSSIGPVDVDIDAMDAERQIALRRADLQHPASGMRASTAGTVTLAEGDTLDLHPEEIDLAHLARDIPGSARVDRARSLAILIPAGDQNV